MAGVGAAAALGLSAADDKLPNGTRGVDQVKADKLPFGDQRNYYSGPTDQLHAMTAGSLLLKPGMSPHAPHQHPEEEFMVITEGTGEISVEGKVTQVGPGSMMYCAAGYLHRIVNTGAKPLLFYFYKGKA